MRTEDDPQREYIGDGVYASFDGYQIWLVTDRYGRMHEVAVEPQVWDSLKAYARKIWGPQA